MSKKLKTYLILGAVVAVLLILAGVFLPHLLKWLAAGTVGAVAVRAGNNASRRKADKTHKQQQRQHDKQTVQREEDRDAAVVAADKRREDGPEQPDPPKTEEEREDRLNTVKNNSDWLRPPEDRN